MSFAVPATPGQGSGTSASYAGAPTPSASGVVSSVGVYNDQAVAADKGEGSSSSELPKQNATPAGVPEITAVQGIVPTLQ